MHSWMMKAAVSNWKCVLGTQENAHIPSWPGPELQLWSDIRVIH